MSRTGHTNGNVPQKIPENLLFPSARAAELIAELDGTLVQKLYNVLNGLTYLEWFGWFEGSREEIALYDSLTEKERVRLIRKDSNSGILLVHHAILYVELWRVRFHHSYSSLPPHGDPLEEPLAQREMMMKVVASYGEIVPAELWPFVDYPLAASLPFRKD